MFLFTNGMKNEDFDARAQSSAKDSDFEGKIRPQDFGEFSGQDKIIENLKIFVKAALLRGEALDHILLHGPPGLGKTTLAHIVANELGVNMKITSGPILDKPGDLAGLLTGLEEGDVLFIDEIHRLTLIGATTRSGLITSPLRARFGITAHLEYYDAAVLRNIIVRSAKILNIGIEERAAMEIAMRSRGTPRIANSLLRRVRDFAQVKGSGYIDVEIASFALDALNIDKRGLDSIDNKILNTIIFKFKGGPVGLGTIATAIGEDPGTVEEVYEPYLIKEGFIHRTPRGREATDLAYSHLGVDKYAPDTLFRTL